MQLSNNDRLKKANELSHGLNDLVACSHANDGGFDRKIAGGSKMIQGEMKKQIGLGVWPANGDLGPKEDIQ